MPKRVGVMPLYSPCSPSDCTISRIKLAMLWWVWRGCWWTVVGEEEEEAPTAGILLLLDAWLVDVLWKWRASLLVCVLLVLVCVLVCRGVLVALLLVAIRPSVAYASLRVRK